MLFSATTLLGEGGGDDGMNPKPSKKLSLGAESYGTIAGKGFFTQSQVLLSSIVAFFPLQIYIYIYISFFLFFNVFLQEEHFHSLLVVLNMALMSDLISVLLRIQ